MAAAQIPGGFDEEGERVRRWFGCSFPARPPEAVSRLEAGQRLLSTGFPGQALKALEKAGDSVRTWACRAEAYLRLGKLPEAAEALERCRALGAPGAVAHLGALISLLGSRGEDARRDLAFLRAAEPRDALAWALGGVVEASLGRREEALELADHAIALRPKRAWPWAIRSLIHRESGGYTACLEDIGRAVSLEPRQGWLHQWRADSLERACRMEGAIAALDRALALNPDNPWAYAQRGHCLFYRKQYRRAAGDFTRASRLAPGTAAFLWRRSQARWLAGDAAGAARDLRACLRLEPRESRYELDLARLDLIAGRRRSALRRLRGLERKDGLDKAGIGYLRGMDLSLRKDHAGAAREFARAEDLARRSLSEAKFCDAGLSAMMRSLKFLADQEAHMPRKHRAQSTLILAGLGLHYPYQATLEVIKALSGCDTIFSNLAGVHAMEFLSLFCRDVRTISYERTGEEGFWADKVFSAVKPGRTVAFVTRGHPLVSGHLARELLQRARRKGVRVQSFGALSTMDSLLALSEEILFETHWSLQVFDCRLIADRQVTIQTSVPMIVYLGIYDPTPKRVKLFIDKLCAELAKRYPAGHKALLCERYDKRELEPVELRALRERLAKIEPDMFSTAILFLPAVKIAAPDVLKRLVEGDHAPSAGAAVRQRPSRV